MKIGNYPKVDRAWGFFDVLVDNFDSRVSIKVLHLMQEEELSLQYHFKKDQLYVIMDDDFEIQHSRERAIIPGNFEEFLGNNPMKIMAKTGDVFLFRKNIIHKAKYVGNRLFGRIIDISFGDSDEKSVISIGSGVDFC